MYASSFAKKNKKHLQGSSHAVSPNADIPWAWISSGLNKELCEREISWDIRKRGQLFAKSFLTIRSQNLSHTGHSKFFYSVKMH